MRTIQQVWKFNIIGQLIQHGFVKKISMFIPGNLVARRPPHSLELIIKILLPEGTCAALKGFVWGGRGGECHSACFSPAGSRGECRVDIYSGQCHLQHQGQTFCTNNRLCHRYDLAFEKTCCLMIVREFLCVCAAASWKRFYFLVKINCSPVARPTAAPTEPKTWAEDSQERRHGYNECVW